VVIAAGMFGKSAASDRLRAKVREAVERREGALRVAEGYRAAAGAVEELLARSAQPEPAGHSSVV
jgi:hypothetical protein